MRAAISVGGRMCIICSVSFVNGRLINDRGGGERGGEGWRGSFRAA